ncbi:hypothetical protein [Hespellia stercorisuis]|uniref:hypothetical protein n=1 Tax=Hespellia stercorisuis TaxID=180311 RepID=UPI0013566B39|nr:hypothetical protein [Hespellia stercorisuis]
MAFIEKNVWCAKMELLGYFADRLPYNDREASAKEYVTDYRILEDYVNPYQELC